MNHLYQLFSACDYDGSGELDWPEFWQLWADLDLGLSDNLIASWQTRLDADGSGTVTWAEFESVGAEMLQDALAARAAALHKKQRGWGKPASNSSEEVSPWVSMMDPSGHPYWLNTTTGVCKWADEEEEEEGDHDDIDHSSSESSDSEDDERSACSKVSDSSSEAAGVSVVSSANSSVRRKHRARAAAAGAAQHHASAAEARAARSPNHGLLVLPLPPNRQNCQLKLQGWRANGHLAGSVTLDWASLQRLCGGVALRTDFAVRAAADYEPPPALAPPLPGLQHGTEITKPGGHVGRRRGGLVELEMLADSSQVLQKLAGLSVCVSAVVEESVVAAPHQVDVVAAVQPESLPPVRRLGASRWPSVKARQPLLSARWATSLPPPPPPQSTQPENASSDLEHHHHLHQSADVTMKRLGSTATQLVVPESSRFVYGSLPPPPPQVSLLTASVSTAGPAFDLSSRLLAPKMETNQRRRFGQRLPLSPPPQALSAVSAEVFFSSPFSSTGLDLEVWDIGGYRLAERVHAGKLQRWVRRCLAHQFAQQAEAAAIVLQRAYRVRLGPKLELRRKMAAEQQAQRERVAAFAARNHEKRVRAAATRIQVWARHCLKTRKLKVLSADRQAMSAAAAQRHDAALCIQRNYRGWRQQRAYRAALKQVKLAKANVGMAKEAWAYLTITQWVRQRRVRREAEKVQAAKKAEKEAKEAWKRGDAPPPGGVSPTGAGAGGAGGDGSDANSPLSANSALGLAAPSSAEPILDSEGDLVLFVVDGQKLPNVDAFGKSDPFVRVRWNGRRVGSTRVKNNNLNPVWCHKFVLPAPSATEVKMPLVPWGRLVLDVLDFDLGSEGDFMGRVVIESWAQLRALQETTVAAVVADNAAQALLRRPQPFKHFSKEKGKPKAEEAALLRLRTLFPLSEKHDDDLLTELETPRKDDGANNSAEADTDAEGGVVATSSKEEEAVEEEPEEDEENAAAVAAAVARQSGVEVRYFRVSLKGLEVEDLAHAAAEQHKHAEEVAKSRRAEKEIERRSMRESSSSKATAASATKASKKPTSIAHHTHHAVAGPSHAKPPSFLGSTGLWSSSKVVLAVAFGASAAALTNPTSANATRKAWQNPKSGKSNDNTKPKEDRDSDDDDSDDGDGNNAAAAKARAADSAAPYVVSWTNDDVELIVSEHFLATTPLDFRIAYDGGKGREGRTVAEASLDLKRLVVPRKGGESSTTNRKQAEAAMAAATAAANKEQGHRTLRLHKPQSAREKARAAALAAGQDFAKGAHGLLGTVFGRLGKPLTDAEIARRRPPPKPRPELGLLKLDLTVEACPKPHRQQLPGQLGLALFLDKNAARERLATPTSKEALEKKKKRGWFDFGTSLFGGKKNKDKGSDEEDDDDEDGDDEDGASLSQESEDGHDHHHPPDFPQYPPPTLLERVGEWFEAASGGSDELSSAEFADVLLHAGLELQLSDVTPWLEAAEASGGFAEGGTVSWHALEGADGEARLQALLKSADRGPSSWVHGDPWLPQVDAQGQAYQLNCATGESRWDPHAFGPDAHGHWSEGEGGEGGAAMHEWEALHDEEGYPYWYDHTTGETTYEDPTHRDSGGHSSGEVGDWVEVVDEYGVSSWHYASAEASNSHLPTVQEEVDRVYTNPRGNRVFIVRKKNPYHHHHEYDHHDHHQEYYDPAAASYGSPLQAHHYEESSSAYSPDVSSNAGGEGGGHGAMAALASPDVSFYESWNGDGQPPREWARPPVEDYDGNGALGTVDAYHGNVWGQGEDQDLSGGDWSEAHGEEHQWEQGHGEEERGEAHGNHEYGGELGYGDTESARLGEVVSPWAEATGEPSWAEEHADAAYEHREGEEHGHEGDWNGSHHHHEADEGYVP